MSENSAEILEQQSAKNDTDKNLIEDIISTSEEQSTNENSTNEIDELKTSLNEEKAKVAMLEKLLSGSIEERNTLRSQSAKLEKELMQENLPKNVKKQEFNDMMTQAKSVIFEKTKVCKNQELQIEALKQQVTSLKEIVAISKDMLDIRNMEVQQLQDKMNCLELKFTAEKDRQKLMHTKLDKMVQLNASLKEEYEKQLSLFSALQNAYHAKMNEHKAEPNQENELN